MVVAPKTARMSISLELGSPPGTSGQQRTAHNEGAERVHGGHREGWVAARHHQKHGEGERHEKGERVSREVAEAGSSNRP